MILKGQWHGNEIYFDADLLLWYYTKDDRPIKDDPQRACVHCGLEATIEGHDGCLGTLPGVTNACCGHGVVNNAYIQFAGGRRTIRKEEARKFIEQQMKDSNDSIHGQTQGNEILVTKED